MNENEIFIVGAKGQLGSALRELYPGSKSADLAELDITNQASVESFDWRGIKYLLNAAAYTNVDGAETPEGRRATWSVNSAAVANLTKIARQHDMTMVHISTDYVFDGTAPIHDEAESYAPLGVYGQSKAAGDLIVSTLEKHYILRTSWVIGGGKNFVSTMKDLAEKGINPQVVNDQIGRLTFTSDLAQSIDHLLKVNAPHGIYNLTNDGSSVSWADIAADVYELSGYERSRVSGVSTREYYDGKENIAPRPLQSTLNLDKIKATGFVPRDWKKALTDYLSTQ